MPGSNAPDSNMPKGSVAYATMRRALLAEVSRVPRGYVVEAASLGEALNIPARYIGHFLARLAPDEEEVIPWHRTIPRGGVFGRAERRSLRAEQQLQLLAQEGHRVDFQRDIPLGPVERWVPDDKHRQTFWADYEADGAA